MVSALDSGASGPGSSPGLSPLRCYITLAGTHLKWVPASVMLGGNPAMD